MYSITINYFDSSFPGHFNVTVTGPDGSKTYGQSFDWEGGSLSSVFNSVVGFFGSGAGVRGEDSKLERTPPSYQVTVEISPAAYQSVHAAIAQYKEEGRGGKPRRRGLWVDVADLVWSGPFRRGFHQGGFSGSLRAARA